MSDRTILATLPKLTGSNWFEWKKEAETFLMLAGLDGIVDSEEVPAEGKAADWNSKDRKTYAYLFFLIDSNYRAPIIDIKSGREAWKRLISEYEKDTATARMGLRQQFYSITHDPSKSVTVFIEAIFSIVRQLGAIGHKPDDLEISDKLLIGLHQSWSPVRTALTLREKSEKPEIDKITAALKQFEANESLLAATSGPSIKSEDPDSGESALYAKGGGGSRLRSGNGSRRSSEEFDWGNTKDRERACNRCGREGHHAWRCVANMPEDVKRNILDHAHIAYIDSGHDDDQAMFAFVSQTGRDLHPAPAPYGSRKYWRRKPGHSSFKWAGEKGKSEFAW